MRSLIGMTMVTALLGLGACGGATGPNDPLDPETEDQENEDTDSDGDGDGGDADEGEAGAPCRSALDCDHAAGLRCQMDAPGLGVCFTPESLDNQIYQMGPAGQPPPPFVPRAEVNNA